MVCQQLMIVRHHQIYKILSAFQFQCNRCVETVCDSCYQQHFTMPNGERIVVCDNCYNELSLDDSTTWWRTQWWNLRTIMETHLFPNYINLSLWNKCDDGGLEGCNPLQMAVVNELVQFCQIEVFNPTPFFFKWRRVLNSRRDTYLIPYYFLYTENSPYLLRYYKKFLISLYITENLAPLTIHLWRHCFVRALHYF
jgi:hypothetical protein